MVWREWRHRARRAAADVGVVAAGSHVERGSPRQAAVLTPTPTRTLPLEGGGPIQIDGGHDRDVGQVRAAVVRVVEHIHVAALHGGVALDHGLDRLAHRAQVHRHVRCVGDQFAVGVEERATEVESLLDVHRVGGVLQPQPHLLGDVHEQVVEDLEHHRVGLGADRMLRGARPHARQLDRAGPHEPRLPAGLDHGGRVLLGHDRRAVDGRAGLQRFAHIEAGLEPLLAVHAHAGVGHRGVARGLHAGGALDEALSDTDRLDRHRFDDQPAVGHQEGEALAVAGLEGLRQLLRRAPGQHQRGVGAPVAQVRVAPQFDLGRRHALARDLVARGVAEFGQPRVGRGQAGGVERQLDRGLAHRDLVRQAHAVGREHARQRVHEDAAHAQRIGHAAGMLAAGAAEALQRVLRDVVAARHRDALDRVGHVLDRDLQEALGQRLGRGLAAGRGLHLGRQRLEPGRDAVAVQRLVGLRPEHLRKVRRLDLAQQHVGVGRGQRPAAPVARRPGVGAGALGPDAQPRTVELQQRAATGGHGVDAHHRRAHAHAGHLGVEGALEFAGVMRHVGAGAAHVEADHLGVTAGHGGAHHADDAAGRAGQDRVLALEVVRFGQAAAALHEEQAHAGHLRGHLVDVAAQDRRQVGVDDGGVTARHQLHQRADLVRGADLREADCACQLGRGGFVRGVAVAMHEDDGHGADAGIEGGLQVAPQRGLIQRLQHLALRADTLVRFDDAFVEQFGQHDVALEQLGPRLVGDAQRVAEALARDQQGAVALAFQEGVGGHRGAHLHALDEVGRDRRARCQAQQAADALDGGVAVLLGVLAQQLERVQRRIGRAADDVGEGAAAVDPELPAWVGVHCRLSQRACT